MSMQFNAYPTSVGRADVAQQVHWAISVNHDQVLQAVVVEIACGQSAAGGFQQWGCPSFGQDCGKTTASQASAQRIGFCKGVAGRQAGSSSQSDPSIGDVEV
jgi:hypothetical protein